MIELYHWEPTSNSGEALVCLKEKGIDFTSRYVDVLAGEQFLPEILKLNPFGQVPILVHDGRVLTETGFILQYLDAAFPGVCLTPRSAEGRYWVGVWIKYVNEYMAPAAWRLGARSIAAKAGDGLQAALGRAPLERQQAWRKALGGLHADELEIAKGLLPIRLERMEAALARSPWLAGDDYSLADIVVFPTAAALVGLAPELIKAGATPRILAWLARVRERPAVQAALAMAKTPRPEQAFAPGPEGSRWG